MRGRTLGSLLGKGPGLRGHQPCLLPVAKAMGALPGRPLLAPSFPRVWPCPGGV